MYNHRDIRPTGASNPNQWCILHIPPISGNVINSPYFRSFRFLASIYFVHEASTHHRVYLTRKPTGRPCRPILLEDDILTSDVYNYFVNSCMNYHAYDIGLHWVVKRFQRVLLTARAALLTGRLPIRNGFYTTNAHARNGRYASCLDSFKNKLSVGPYYNI